MMVSIHQVPSRNGLLSLKALGDANSEIPGDNRDHHLHKCGATAPLHHDAVDPRPALERRALSLMKGLKDTTQSVTRVLLFSTTISLV